MAISFKCPSCQKPYKVKDELAGKKAACTQCKAVMNVPRPTVSAEESQAVEAMATAALVEESKQHEALNGTGGAVIKLECEYCFEAIEFPVEKAGKKAPCPSCRRIITVPAASAGTPKNENWRQVKDNLTMARKDSEAAPEGAWGNAELQKQVVSREALMEAKVIVDRKTQMAPDRTKLYIGLAMVAALAGIAGFMFYRGKADDANRLGLVTGAIKGIGTLPAGWPAAVGTAAGVFYLHEPQPDLKAATRQFQDARAAIRQIESLVDKAGLVAALASAQAELVGDDAKIEAKRALDWSGAKRELRQTVEICKELPREDGWLVLEELTRVLKSAGQSQPLIVSLAGDAMPGEADRLDGLAAAALTLRAIKDPNADKVADELLINLPAEGSGPAGPRVVALLIARDKLEQAKKLLPEPTGDDPPLVARVAYAEGYARAGDFAKAKKIAMLNGSVEHKVAALAMLADAAVDASNTEELQSAVAFVAEQGKTFTLPTWAVLRLGRACGRAGQGDLVRQLAENVKLPAVTPWLRLAALDADLRGTTKNLDSPAVSTDDKSAAQALAWISLARHNTRMTRGDPRNMLSAWPVEQAKVAGAAGAALGIQDRLR